MHYIYVIKNSVKPADAFRMAEEMLAQLSGQYVGRTFASIIYTEHDMRTAAEMKPEDALKKALDTHGISLGILAKRYTKIYAEDKIGALSSIQAASLVEPGCFGDMMKNYVYETNMGILKNGRAAVEIFTEWDGYLEEMAKQPYVDIEVKDSICSVGEVFKESKHELCCPMSMDRGYVLKTVEEAPVDKQYRTSMLMLDKVFLKKASELPGWEEANKKENIEEWIESREKVAMQLIDDKALVEILDEPTGFEASGDLKEATDKIIAPIRGIMMNRPVKK